MTFFKSSDKFLEEIDRMTLNPRESISYGVPFLDDALDGIYEDDFIVVTAKTGGGKTELVSTIANNAAQSGKQVYYFALEAHVAEIQARIKFKLLSQAFYYQKNWRDFEETPDYQRWIHGKQANILSKFYPEVDQELMKYFKNLHVYYSDHTFDIEKFEGMMGMIGSHADLIILDHVHHMELVDTNEIKAMKILIRQLKKIISFYRKPMILVAQLRKGERFSQQLVPTLDEIYGASELSKIVTAAIATAPAWDSAQKDSSVFPTYFKLMKNRLSGARTFYAALCGFDNTKNEYAPYYQLGILKNEETKFEELESWHYPRWAKGRQAAQLDLGNVSPVG